VIEFAMTRGAMADYFTLFAFMIGCALEIVSWRTCPMMV